MTTVKTAVFPVAGFGTRFLPATKATPKVMLPIVDRPLIQYAVDEATTAGIDHHVFVTGRGHGAVEDYFDLNFELEAALREKGKIEIVEILDSMRPEPGQYSFMRQIEPLGLGHAVWCARHTVGTDPFAVLLADELFITDTPDMVRMLEVHEEYGGNVVLVSEVPADHTDRYGIITPGGDVHHGCAVEAVVEKPAPGTAPSNLAIVGRYILDPSIMDILGETEPGAGGEIQLTDALLTSIGQVPFHAVTATGQRFDCGSKSGFVEATLHVALGRPDMADRVQAMIDSLASPQN